MTTDLWMLVASAFLAWALILAAAMPKLLEHGPKWALGNRGSEPETDPEGWVERAVRASANMQENLPLFAVLVLVAHVTHNTSDLSATGAIIFFAGRAAHAVIYIAGIPGLRTGAWAVSVVGMVLVAAVLVG